MLLFACGTLKRGFPLAFLGEYQTGDRKPGNFRYEIDVISIDGGERARAYAYFKSPELAVPMHSGYLQEYRDRRFIPPWERKA